jgi:hypothetical protein
MVSIKLITLTAVATLTPFLVTPVYAQTTMPTGTSGSLGARQTVRQQDRLTRVRQRGDNELSRRITALTNQVGRIQDMKRLTSDQKTSFTNQIQAEITSLQTLKAKIDADTDLTTLLADVQSIVQSYRVFALFMPKIAILAHADRLMSVDADMGTISTKLQDRITRASTAGKDVSAVNNLMTDRAAKLTDANTQAQNAINAVLPLDPSGYPGNKTTLTNARDMLKTGRTDLRTAFSDAQQIRQILKGFGF